MMASTRNPLLDDPLFTVGRWIRVVDTAHRAAIDAPGRPPLNAIRSWLTQPGRLDLLVVGYHTMIEPRLPDGRQHIVDAARDLMAMYVEQAGAPLPQTLTPAQQQMVLLGIAYDPEAQRCA